MFAWLKSKKKTSTWQLIGTSKWSCAYGDGLWLYYEDKEGNRRFEPTYIPYMYEDIGGQKRIPGYSEALVWKLGGVRKPLQPFTEQRQEVF